MQGNELAVGRHASGSVQPVSQLLGARHTVILLQTCVCFTTCIGASPASNSSHAKYVGIQCLLNTCAQCV